MSEYKEEDYKSIFIESLGINSKDFHQEIKYNEVNEWDSIGHMTLISALEEKFKITFETDDIVDFSSYKEGINILKKYKILVTPNA